MKFGLRYQVLVMPGLDRLRIFAVNIKSYLMVTTTMRSLFTAVLIIAFSACSDAQEAQVSPDEFKAMIDTLKDEQLVDVRTPAEFSEGHLEGAINIDYRDSTFASKVLSLDKSRPVMVYCGSGRRSAAAAEHLKGQGFKVVYDMRG